jgi:RND family efflux transporter MFP subunit
VIEPRQVINLSTSVEGVIASISVERGEVVTKGQVIATLESDVEESSVTLARERAASNTTILSARAQVKMLEHKLTRAKKMHIKKHTSDADLDEISTDLSVARHQVAEALHQKKLSQLELAYSETVLEQRVIHSPINGVVVERMMSPGEYRNEQSHIVTLAEIDPLNVEMFVPLELFGQLRQGDAVKVIPEAPFDQQYEATVTIIDKVFDAASATIGVRMSLPNPDHLLPAGIKCTAQVGI